MLGVLTLKNMFSSFFCLAVLSFPLWELCQIASLALTRIPATSGGFRGHIFLSGFWTKEDLLSVKFEEKTVLWSREYCCVYGNDSFFFLSQMFSFINYYGFL